MSSVTRRDFVAAVGGTLVFGEMITGVATRAARASPADQTVVDFNWGGCDRRVVTELDEYFTGDIAEDDDTFHRDNGQNIDNTVRPRRECFLRTDGDPATIISHPDADHPQQLPYYPKRGDRIVYRHYMYRLANNLAFFLFGVQTDPIESYAVKIDAGDETLSLEKASDGSARQLDSTPISYDRQYFHQITIEWGTDIDNESRIEVQFDHAGTNGIDATVAADNDTLDRGGIGFMKSGSLGFLSAANFWDRIDAHQVARSVADETIAELAAMIDDANADDLEVTEAEDFLTDAQREFNAGNYHSAGRLAKEGIDVVTEAKAARAIQGLERDIETARDRGLVINEAAELLESAEEAYDRGEYNQAKELAVDGQQQLDETVSAAAEARETIQAAENINPQLQTLGNILFDSDEILTNAQQAYDQGNYDEAAALAQEVQTINTVYVPILLSLSALGATGTRYIDKKYGIIRE